MNVCQCILVNFLLVSYGSWNYTKTLLEIVPKNTHKITLKITSEWTSVNNKKKDLCWGQIEEVEIRLTTIHDTGKIAPQIIIQFCWWWPYLTGRIKSGASEIKIIIFELERLWLNINELIFSQNGFNTPRVLLRVSKKDSFSQFEVLFCRLLQQLHLKSFLISFNGPHIKWSHVESWHFE